MKNNEQNWIQKVIEVSGVSLNEFGRRIGVASTTVSKWNRGVSEPAFHNIKKVRSVFKEEKREADEYFKIKNNE